MAKIVSLEEMEKIVSRNKMLSWDGWTVLYTYPNPVGWKDTNGMYDKKKGKWFVQRRYEPTNIGWDIPGKLMR